ncbi:MAG: hypothetical protein FWF29_04415, partial [Treponema sp.]|nr:hypothetical protein [Treponema sp.]
DNAAGYLAIGSGAGSLITGQNDFTIAGYIYIENAATLTGNGWFLWCFSDTANAGQTVGNYVFLRPIDTRHTIGHGGYSNESNVSLGGTLSKNLWMHLMYRQQGMLGVLYMDGKPVAAASTLYNSTDLGSLSYGWLGRSCYSTDIMMKYTRYADFRIYPGAISDAQIAALDIPDTINVLNADQYTSDVSSAITTVTAMLGDLSAVSKDITLPVLNNGVTITWSSGNPAVLSNSGVVTRPPYAQGDATVTLTGTFTKGNASGTHDFTVTVLKQPGAAEMVATKITEAEIALGDLSTVDSNITLPASDAYVTVGWSSDNTAALSNTGAVTRQSNHTSLTLTGTFTSTADTSVSVKNTWPVRVMGIGASEEEFLNVHYEAVQGMGLQNTAESGNYYTPSLSGDAAAAANASAGINYIDIGSNGYINLGSKIGALIRKPEWTIEFYMRTTSDTGTMVSFANDNNISTTANTPWRGVFTFVNPNLTVKAYNHGRYGNAATNSTPSNSDYVATGNSGGLGSGHTNEWVHLMLIKSSDGGINIFRNGDCAQNARANDFSRLNTDAAFGAADADTDPLQFAYLGQSPFRNISASASDSDVQYVPHVYFYDFKMYSKALIPHNGTDQTTVDNYLKSDRVAVKSKLNSAFGYPDNQ